MLKEFGFVYNRLYDKCLKTISIIMLSDSLDSNTYHSLKRQNKKRVYYTKPQLVEFFSFRFLC